jgi:RimJ/RimL family protein N-acetyltransferase
MAAPAQVRVSDPDIVAQTVRLTLRWPQPKDALLWAAYLNDFDVSKMMARVPYPYAAADAAEWLARVADNRATGASVNCTIIADMLVGGISLNGVSKGEADLGYWIAKPYWGHGFAREAARAMMDYAFIGLGLRAVRSGFFEENPRSGRILSGLGFEETGRGPHPCRARNTDVAHVDMRLTRQRWEAMQ